MKRTYETEHTWRASEIDAGGHLVYRDTIFADGTVYSSVRGVADGEHVDSRKVHEFDGPIDWDVVHAARLRQGFRLVEECTCHDGSCVLCDDDGFRPVEAAS